MCLPCLDPNGAAGCNPSHSLFGHAWRVPALLLMAQQFVSEAQWGGSNTDREAVRISLGCARDAVDASPTGSEAPLWSRAGLPLDAGNSWNLDAISLSLCGASHEKAEKVQRGESKRQVQVVFPVNQKEEFHQLDCLCVREREIKCVSFGCAYVCEVGRLSHDRFPCWERWNWHDLTYFFEIWPGTSTPSCALQWRTDEFEAWQHLDVRLGVDIWLSVCRTFCLFFLL